MKSVKTLTIAALLLVPTFAMAQKSTTLPNQPGQSEFAPGQRAQQPGAKDAKDYAPGQRRKIKDVKGQPGASEYAPGHLPSKDVKR
jgi:Spy/CpxP family protein refolding chaperone